MFLESSEEKAHFIQQDAQLLLWSAHEWQADLLSLFLPDERVALQDPLR